MINLIFFGIIHLLIIGFKIILNTTKALYPSLSLTALEPGITSFFGILGNAINMTNFLIGPAYLGYITIAITIWTTRHSILPLICFIRKCIIKN